MMKQPTDPPRLTGCYFDFANGFATSRAHSVNSCATGLLILYHRANAGGAMALPDPEDVLLDEVRSLYDGNVVTGHDLDIF